MVDDINTVAIVGWKDLTWRMATAFGCVVLTVLELWLVAHGSLHVEIHQKDGVINFFKILPFFILPFGVFVFLWMETEHHRKRRYAELERKAKEARGYLSDLRNRYPVDSEVKQHLVQIGYANVAAYIDELEYKVKEVQPK